MDPVAVHAKRIGEIAAESEVVFVVGGKKHSAIHDEQPAQVFENRHVAADFADPAQRGDPKPAWCQRPRRRELHVHRHP